MIGLNRVEFAAAEAKTRALQFENEWLIWYRRENGWREQIPEDFKRKLRADCFYLKYSLIRNWLR